MTFVSWLRTLKNSLKQPQGKRSSRRGTSTVRQRACPLTLEHLEDRMVLSNVTTPSLTVSDFGVLARDNSGNLTSPAGTPITLYPAVFTDSSDAYTDGTTGLGYYEFSWSVTRNGVAIPSDTATYGQSDIIDPSVDMKSFTFTPDQNGTYVVSATATLEGDGNYVNHSTTSSETIDVAPAVAINGGQGLALAGAADPAFGNGGQVITSLGTGDDGFNAVAVQKDGKIVTTGWTASNNYDIALARYNPDGTLDTTFGTVNPSTGLRTGITTTDIAHQSNDNGYAVAIDSQGRIVVGGETGITQADGSSQNYSFLARYNSDGSLDTTFGNNGFVLGLATDLNNSPNMTLDGNDNILVDGMSVNGPAVARYTSSGILDSTFGSSGVELIQVDPNGGFTPSSVTVDNQGNILVAGTDVSYDPNFAATKWTHNGDGGPGAGNFSTAVVVRYGSQGSLDNSFGGSGIVTLTPGSVSDSAYFGGTDCLVTAPQGGYVVEWATSTGHAELIRLTPSGALATDPTTGFGSLDSTTNTRSGSILTSIITAGFPTNNLVVQSDGQIVVTGTRGPNFGVARFNADGSPDGSFAPGGMPGGPIAETTADTPLWDSASALGSNGKIVMVGETSSNGTNGSFLLEQVVGVPPHSPVGTALSFTSTVNDPNASPAYQWTVTKDGSSYALASGTVTNTSDFSFTPNALGTYVVTLSVTDPDGTTVSDSKTIEVRVDDPFSYNGMQATLDSQPPIDPTTGNPTVTLQGDTQAQADEFMALFQNPATPGFTPLQPPAGATTPIDIVVTFDSSVQLNEAALNIPDGIRVQINGGTWLGGSPALTLLSGDLTITGATFANATNAPTILVNAGHLTLRNDVIQESTGYSQSAIAITGGSVDLGTAASPGGNTLNINSSGSFIQNATSTPITAVGTTFLVNGVALAPASLSGIVFEDFNDDGQVDFGEQGIAGAAVALTGTDFLGNAVSMSTTTDSDGAYIFANLQPGSYSITETQPSGYNQGINTVGTVGGSLAATDQFLVTLAQNASGLNGLNYNFGEQPPATEGVQKGQTAGIGFWNNKNGQALIQSFNGGPTSTQLAAWLAATLPHIFGADAGSNALIHADGSYFTNAEVAARFQQDFVVKGVKLDAQLLATALSVYATNATLDDTGVATKYGFVVSGDGVGTAGVSVGSSGNAFGVANNTVLTVLDLLKATDAQAVDGLLYNGDAVKRKEANSVYSAINDAGNIG